MAVDLGEGVITVVPDLKKFTPLLNSKLGPVWKAATSGAGVLTLAFAAAGAASIKMAADFQDSMNRVQALVGISAKNVGQLSTQVLDLAKTVTPGPVELANALYYVTSAGFRGAEAMSVLTDAAKAATAGLGTTSDIADVLTSAMNSYATSGLTATRATDILIAAVREGKTDPAKFATSLGQVLPVAAQMGVTFDQVAAAIASSTREGFFASRAAIGLRYLIAAMIRPSQGATEALNSVGFSIERLQNELRTKGLLFTLRDLAKRLDLSTAAGKEAFATIVGGVRGMSTAAILIGENSKAITGVFDRVKNSAGSLATAFEVSQQRLSVQWKLFVNQIQVAAITFGTALLPIATTVVKVFQAMFSPIAKFIGLLARIPDAVAVAVAAFVGFNILTTVLPIVATALQTVVFLFVRLGAISIQTGGTLARLAAALGESAGAMTVFAAAAALVVIAIGKIHGYINQDNEAAASWAQTVLKGSATLRDYKIAVDQTIKSSKTLGDRLFTNRKLQEAYNQAAQEVNTTIAQQYRTVTGLTTTLKGVGSMTGTVITTTTTLNDVYAQMAFSAQRSANDNLLLNRTFGNLLAVAKSYGMALPDAVQINAAAAAGNLSQAIRLLGDDMGYTTQQTKDMVKQGAFFVGNTQKMTVALSGLSTLTGQSFKEISDQAYQTFQLDGQKFGQEWDKMMANISQSLSDFRDNALKSLDFISSTFQTMAQRVDKNGKPIAMTAQSILKSFQDAAAQTKEFGKNLLEIANIAGGKGKALSSWLLSLGPDGAQAAAVIADSSKKTQEQIAKTFNKAQSESTSLADKLTKKIVGVLGNIETILKRIASQQFGININLNDHGAEKHVVSLQDKLNMLTSRGYTVGVGVHIAPTSPWPDEALKMHLYDPMKRMGFKKINGAWTLPLEIGVHSSTQAIAEAMAKAQSLNRTNGNAGLTPHQRLERMSTPFTPSSHRVVRVLNGVPIAHGPRPLRFSYPQTNAPTEYPLGKLPTPGQMPKLNIHLDRKRFSEQLSYDAMYRGW